MSWLVPDPTDPSGCSVACADTLEFNCTPGPKPKCASIVNDTVYCENDTVKYTFQH